MRLRIAISIAVGTFALAFATQALADPPAQGAPGPGQMFTSGDVIVFTVTSPSPTPPGELQVHISRDAGIDMASGLLANRFDQVRAHAIGSATYQGSPDQDEGWPKKPGTYYWQVADSTCVPVTSPAECASGALPLVINPLQASAVTSPNQVETFLEKRPRHRTHKRKIKFRFSSNVDGAKFQCLFASGWEKCSSPHVFRHLKPGRYKFEVRAVANDIEDPDPETWFFRVLRH